MSRLVCPNCRIEMTCAKNGHIVRYGRSYCYSGDRYECKECGNTSVILESSPFEHDGKLGPGEYTEIEERENEN